MRWEIVCRAPYVIKGKHKYNLFPMPVNICRNYIDRSSTVWYTLDTMSHRNPKPDKYATPYTLPIGFTGSHGDSQRGVRQEEYQAAHKGGMYHPASYALFTSDGWGGDLWKKYGKFSSESEFQEQPESTRQPIVKGEDPVLQQHDIGTVICLQTFPKQSKLQGGT